MPTQAPDPKWPDSQRRIDQSELAGLCDLTEAELDELVEFGALVPLVGDTGTSGRQFPAACVVPLREAARLRADYDLDLFTVSLVLGYLQRIAQLEHQVQALHPQLPHPQQLPREGPTPWREPHA